MIRKILLIPLLLGANSMLAQSIGPGTMNAAGATATIGSTNVEWSVGEMTMVSTFSTPGIVVTQGVLQPTSSDPTRADDNAALLRQLQVFPNPATSVVSVQYSSQLQGTLSYKLMDMAGRVITTKKSDIKQGTNTVQVNIADLAVATYMLEVAIDATGGVSSKASYKIDKLQ